MSTTPEALFTSNLHVDATLAPNEISGSEPTSQTQFSLSSSTAIISRDGMTEHSRITELRNDGNDGNDRNDGSDGSGGSDPPDRHHPERDVLRAHVVRAPDLVDLVRLRHDDAVPLDDDGVPEHASLWAIRRIFR